MHGCRGTEQDACGLAEDTFGVGGTQRGTGEHDADVPFGQRGGQVGGERSVGPHEHDVGETKRVDRVGCAEVDVT